ncbi:hypothetical protein C8A00DRAFT_14304 [Chaetomidium leptoderma]|uniref:Alcohol dehydrogenase-like C-terminal domain-containing protein n=1 Tax=Chaetomidium leptoderma TaxID=669021 RepID=A0AAN6VN19_9PEZI|nr:hypothetical protein C8A00DRAFT_14304 [Chaetomidium leptoderma]
MSDWPSSIDPPECLELRHYIDPDDYESAWSLEDGEWPSLDVYSALPLHIVKVCAVAIHRDELKMSELEKERVGLVGQNPGYEFSGYVQAATVPIGALVAYQALFEYPLLREPGLDDWGRTSWDDGWNQWITILITGAATPVGVWAVQLAKLAGVGNIAATCDAENMDMVRRLGADQVYDWTGEGSLREWNHGRFPAVLDLMGGKTLNRAWRVVAEEGKIVSVVGNVEWSMPKVVNPNIQDFDTSVENCPKILHTIAMLADRGLVRAVCNPEDVFHLSDFEEALERLSRHPRGQVVLMLDPSAPTNKIAVLESSGDKWDETDFSKSNMQRAEAEDADEDWFPLAKWLRTEGSNHPDLAPPTASELMPPPPVSQAMSKVKKRKGRARSLTP